VGTFSGKYPWKQPNQLVQTINLFKKKKATKKFPFSVKRETVPALARNQTPFRQKLLHWDQFLMTSGVGERHYCIL